MGSITLRVRSVVWFVTGALLATMVTLMFVHAWRADAAPGDSDATFVAVTPCRLADTRPAPNRVGPAATLGPAGTQTFGVHGSNGECTIPAEAVAVSLNVTPVGATQRSFLTFWPDGDRPLASSLNPAPGEPPTPNAVTVDLSGAGGFNVFNNKGFVDVVIDVNGYYTQTSLKDLVNRLSAVEAAAAANAAGIVGLDEAQPFAVTNRDDFESLGSADEVVVSVDVAAPTAGQVTVAYATTASQFTAGLGVQCSITTGTTTDDDHLQQWESPGLTGAISPIAGVRTFDLVGGSTTTYNLVCERPGSGTSSSLDDSVLTAVFTPAP